MGKLSNRVALVTGAGTGVGRAIALTFAKEGATVILNGRREEKLQEVAKEIGKNAIVLAADVSSEKEVEKLFNNLDEKTDGTLDILVNNAGGVSAMAPITDMTLGQWNAMVDLNLTSQFLMTRQFLPLLRESGNGKLFSITSGMVNLFMKGMGGYSASKAGVEALMQTVAVEEKDNNVQVNMFDPLNAITESNPNGEHDPIDLVGVLVDLAASSSVERTGEVIKPNVG